MKNYKNKTVQIKPQWWPRIEQFKIRRLYESEASGLLDTELLEEIFIDLRLRCKDMLIVTSAHNGGPIMCASCEASIKGREQSSAGDYIIQCPKCEWEITWQEYWKTYKEKKLVAGGTIPAIELFLKEGSNHITSKEKMLLIDQLIHTFHWETMQKPCRPGAANLIQGKADEVLAFLHDLTNGEPKDPIIKQRWQTWKALDEKVSTKLDEHCLKIREKKLKKKEIIKEREQKTALRKKYKHIQI